MPNPTRIELLPGEEVHVVALPDTTPPPPDPVDVSGEWEVNVSIGGATETFMLVIDQNGPALDATHNDLSLSGMADSEGFQLSGAVPFYGTIEINALIEGEGFRGSISLNGTSGTITGRRPVDDVPPPPPPDPDPNPGPIVGDPNHAVHFQNEAGKPGIILARAYRSNAEVQADKFRGDNVGYDPVVDAAFSLIRGGNPDHALTQIRAELPRRASGVVYVQYELMMDDVLASPLYEPYGLKLWRAEDADKVGDSDERRITENSGLGPDAAMYFRDGAQLWQLSEDGTPDASSGRREVRRKLADRSGYDEQPGGDCRNWYREHEPHPITFRYAPNVWVRKTIKFDFTNGRLNVWAIRMDNPNQVLQVIGDYPVPAWNSQWGLTRCGLWTHSTGRLRGDWQRENPNLPDARLYYRNLLVSSNPIAY